MRLSRKQIHQQWWRRFESFLFQFHKTFHIAVSLYNPLRNAVHFALQNRFFVDSIQILHSNRNDLLGGFVLWQNTRAEHDKIDWAKATKNKATHFIESLMQSEIDSIDQKLIRPWNLQAIKLVLDRIMPPRTSRSIEIEIPKIENSKDILQAISICKIKWNSYDSFS